MLKYICNSYILNAAGIKFINSIHFLNLWARSSSVRYQTYIIKRKTASLIRKSCRSQPSPNSIVSKLDFEFQPSIILNPFPLTMVQFIGNGWPHCRKNLLWLALLKKNFRSCFYTVWYINLIKWLQSTPGNFMVSHSR